MKYSPCSLSSYPLSSLCLPLLGSNSKIEGRRLLGALFLLCFAALCFTGVSLAQDESADFKIVVHADNPTTSLEADDIAKMFRKKIRRWDHDVSVEPVDLKSGNPVRKAFTKKVHNKSVTAIKSYWQRMIFSARGVPPKELETDEEVLEFVRENPGAIGYVSDGASLGEGAKELEVIYED